MGQCGVPVQAPTSVSVSQKRWDCPCAGVCIALSVQSHPRQPWGATAAALFIAETPRFLLQGSSSTGEQHFEEQSEFPPQGGTIKLLQRANPKVGSSLSGRLLGAHFSQK